MTSSPLLITRFTEVFSFSSPYGTSILGQLQWRSGSRYLAISNYAFSEMPGNRVGEQRPLTCTRNYLLT